MPAQQDESPAGTDDPQGDAAAGRWLAGHAIDRIGRAPGPSPARAVLRWVTRGGLGRATPGWPLQPELGTPWQDTPSGERAGWRERAAVRIDPDTPAGSEELVFSVDYRTCRRCKLGWIEHPWTNPRYARCGVASAGLAALRHDHPHLSWHTLGGHFPNSRPFWSAVGREVAGGYAQRPLCRHVAAG
jgi:hypothetical protein